MGGNLYADAIAKLIAVDLFQNYSNTNAQIKNYLDALPKSKLKLVIEYIDANLNYSLSLSELGQLMQISLSYFARLFKKSTGLAPHQYLIRQRVKRTKTLLKQRKLSIAEIADAVGFANQAHLNYHFKRLTGITPKAAQRD